MQVGQACPRRGVQAQWDTGQHKEGPVLLLLLQPGESWFC